jgi:hypothetical protein
MVSKEDYEQLGKMDEFLEKKIYKNFFKRCEVLKY